MMKSALLSGFEPHLVVWQLFTLASVFAQLMPPPPPDSLEVIQHSYKYLCPWTNPCHGNYSLEVYGLNFKPRNLCCAECSCEENCHLYHTCCPEILTEMPTVTTPQASAKYGCFSAHLKTHEQTNISNEAYWMVQKCDKNIMDGTLKDKCHLQNRTSLDSLLPVSDIKTKVVYRNKYCALCNSLTEEQFTYWRPYIRCRQNVFFPSSMGLLTAEIQGRDDCNIWFYPNKGLPAEKCDFVITECNVTGRWDRYEKLLEDACKLFHAPFFGKYGNVFCYMCNEHSSVTDEEIRSYTCRDLDPHVFTNFASLLVFDTFEKEGHFISEDIAARVDCSYDQVFDPFEERCRPVYCKPPKMLSSNGTCINMVENFSGLCLDVFVKFTAYKGLIDQETFHNISLQYLIDKFKTMGVTNSIIFFKSYQTEIRSDTADSRGNASIAIVHVGLFIRIFTNGLKVYDLLSNMAGDIIYEHPDMSKSEDMVAISVILERLHYDMDSNATYLVIDNETIPLHLFSVTYPNRFQKCPRTFDQVLITKQSSCPLVRLSGEEVATEPLEARVTILNGSAVLLPREFLRTTYDYSIEVCAEDYLRKAKELKKASPNTADKSEKSFLSGKQILSFVCTCLSLTCLCLSFLTYCLFRELRTLPGRNNMALIGSLIVAQSLLQFGTGQKNGISYGACFTIGLLVHFFWLAVLFWSNVCAVHMFRVFTRLRQLNASTEGSGRYFLYFCYCFCGPALLVATNIVTSYILSDNRNYGYVSDLCYISSRKMVAFTFALPAGIIVLINLVLFLIVVIQLSRMPLIETAVKKTRNNFKVYAKLSSITGTTWLSGFLFFFINEPIFEYIFIILNASQGIFIFLSFIVNRRVINLYKDCYRGEQSSLKIDTLGTPVSSRTPQLATKITHN